MKQIFISSVQKEFEKERAAIKKMVETDSILKRHFKAFVFEIDAPAVDRPIQQVYLEEVERSDIYLVLIGDKYGCCRAGERSPTEQEYDKATELGLPKLVMVRGADDVREIPNAVIAEAVNNAIAHRSYTGPASIQVEIYRDRVEVTNPGRLHPSLTIKDLYKKHESCPPNARIAHAMYQVKYIEALGTGLTDLLRRCREAGLKKPLLEEVSGRFRIVLWRRKTTNKAEIKASNDAKIIAALKENGSLSLLSLANKLQIKYSALRARIEVLKTRGLSREGSRKTGRWVWRG